MTPRRRPALPLAATVTVAVLAGAAWAAEVQASQPPVATAPPVVAQAGKPSVSTKEAIRPAPVRNAPPQRTEAKPTWVELTPQQQASLAPLSATWPTLGAAHKRKWLALSENFHTMPPPEQARLHSRMTEWAALSAQQRNAARLNFAEAKKVSPEDKRAKWEAYQALPPEEKKRLAARAAATKPPPPGTAIAVKPVPKEKLAKIPPKTRTKGVAPKGEPPPPLVIVPGPSENSALLPTPASPTAP